MYTLYGDEETRMCPGKRKAIKFVKAMKLQHLTIKLDIAISQLEYFENLNKTDLSKPEISGLDEIKRLEMKLNKEAELFNDTRDENRRLKMKIRNVRYKTKKEENSKNAFI